MDLWLVTRKPVGLIEEGSGQVSGRFALLPPSAHQTRTKLIMAIRPYLLQTFIFKSHILAGAPSPTSLSSFSDYAWLTKEEIRQALGGEEVDAGAADGLDAETPEKPQSVWRQVEALLS